MTLVPLAALLLAAAPPAGEHVYFAFDEQSLPWRDNLQLTPVRAEKHPANPVLRRGPAGAPDHGHAILYGTVVRDGDKFRMWYLGMGETEWKSGQAAGWWRPMCYAESPDGVTWTKPDLGLVEYAGSRHNNACLIESDVEPLTRVDDFLSVLYEPDDPDPARRYKAAYIAHVPNGDIKGGVRGVAGLAKPESRNCSLVTAVSGDGLRWRVLGDRPGVNEKFEASSLYKFGRFYYTTGQQITPWSWLPDGRPAGRVMTAYRSPDLLHWSPAKALAFARPGQRVSAPLPGQQTHMGAGLWSRGNVLVGLYGMWQDPLQKPAKKMPYNTGLRVDLGLVVSNDGVHFREPVPDFKVIPRGQDGDWDAIALLQGHAFVNVGDKTYVWYSHWDCEGLFRSQEIGLATLRRDGFGYLSRRDARAPGHLVTADLPATASGPALAINADGVSPEHPLTVELLDEADRPVPGFSGADAAKLTEPGTRKEVVWPGGRRGPGGRTLAARVNFPAAGDVKLYAVYAEP